MGGFVYLHMHCYIDRQALALWLAGFAFHLTLLKLPMPTEFCGSSPSPLPSPLTQSPPYPAPRPPYLYIASK